MKGMKGVPKKEEKENIRMENVPGYRLIHTYKLESNCKAGAV
jgi:hypothetical protein